MILEVIERAATQSTPEIHACPEQGLLRMKGDSYPENSFELFGPVLEWIEALLQQGRALQLELRVAYMNTSSVKAMMDIFDLMEDAHGKGGNVAVRWYYDPRNERVIEMVEEFKEDCSFPFDVLPEDI
ncbi:MAG: biofilm regulation phosphoprotein SiaC [Marinobacter sp.]|nr:biofilm regulation phosphoprotein SiaC [Marinobacter sp.]